MKNLFTFAMLTPFMPLVSFYSPENIREPKDLLMFSGGIERNKCNELNKVTRKK